MAYPDSIYQQEMARRKINEALMKQALTPDQTQYAGGRTVPYSPVTGLSKIAMALMARQGLNAADAEKLAAEKAYTEKAQAATQNVLGIAQGQPEAMNPTPNAEGGYSGVPGDPVRAAVTAAGDPNVPSGVSAVLNSMLKAKQGRGDYSTMTPGAEGGMIFNTRTQGWEYRPYPKEFSGPIAYDAPRKRDLAAAGAGGKVAGESQAQAAIDLPATEARTSETVDLVDELLSHPGFKDVVGLPDNPFALKGYMPGTEAAGAKALLDQITGRTFMEIYPTLKGGGQITEIEGKKGQESINRMKSATSEKEFIKAAQDFKDEVNRLRNLTRQKAGLDAQKEAPPQENAGYIEIRTLEDGRKIGKKADGTIEVIGG